MLKIIDNVDLKELEKFGFEFYDFDYVANKPYDYSLYIKQCDFDYMKQIAYEVIIKARNIEVRKCEPCGYSVVDDETSKLYINDLIQAGLIEKV